MIAACMNPECRKELVYLRDGRVIRLVRRNRERVWMEHFWLCGECLVRFDFRISEMGEVVLERRLSATGTDLSPAARPDGDRLMVAYQAAQAAETNERKQPALRGEPQKWARAGAA
jgi:hypothetical protein